MKTFSASNISRSMMIALALLLPTTAAVAVDESDRPAIEKMIRNYLITNPQILLEVQQALEEKQSGGASVIIFVFALVMVFLILAAQYEQWSLPIAVLTAVPFGIFGALVSVWARGMENDVYFQIGLVTLIGLSTKNAILIVEFAELKYNEGMAAKDAALEAARLRLRPILMTSLSFILGAMPLVLATGAGAAARHSIGTGIIGGMIGATTLALFFVPLFYYLIITAKEKMAGKKPVESTASVDGEA